MLRFNRKASFVALMMGVAILGTASSADAAFKLYIDGGSGTQTVQDGLTGDSSTGANGSIVFVGSVGNVNFTITTGLSKPSPLVTNNNFQAQMDLQVSASSVTAGTYTIMLTDTDFELSGGPNYIVVNSAQGNGVTGGTVAYQSIVDMRNVGTNEFTPVGDINGTTVVSAGLQGPYSSSPINQQNSLEFGGTSPFSITQIITLTFGDGGGSVTSLDFKTTVTTPVPASLALVACASPMFGAWFLRRRAKQKLPTQTA